MGRSSEHWSDEQRAALSEKMKKLATTPAALKRSRESGKIGGKIGGKNSRRTWTEDQKREAQRTKFLRYFERATREDRVELLRELGIIAGF